MRNTYARGITISPVLTLAFGLFLALPACGGKEAPQAAPLPEVTVSQPLIEPVTDYLDFTGNAEASETVNLQARVSGFLTKVAFKDGDMVKQGSLLFEIEPEPYAEKAALAEAAVKAAEAELLRATLEYNRQADLVKQKAVAVAEVEKARALRDTAQARVEQAKSELAISKIQLSYTTILAPFDGRLDRRLKDPGNLVGSGEATLLTTIRKMDPIYAYFSINEKDLVRVRRPIKPGEQREIFAGIEGEDGYPHRGVIDFGSTSLDTSTGTLLLRGVFQNEPLGLMPKILPGMFVRLRVPVGKREQAVLVPERALGIDQGGRYVLVVGDQSVVDKRPVKTGALVRNLRVIEEGLSGEEQVIIAGLQQARPGSKVKPISAKQTSSAESAVK